MSGKFRIATVLVVLGLLLSACAAPAPAPAPAPTAAPAAAEAGCRADRGAARPPKPAAEPVKLVVWWWGEQEAPGAQKWLDETIAKYTGSQPQRHLRGRAAIHRHPDPGVPVGRGGQARPRHPVLLGRRVDPGERLERRADPGGRPDPGRGEGATRSTTSSAATTASCGACRWYLSGNPFVYNPKLFEKAGVDPKAVKTWDDLKAACAQAEGCRRRPHLRRPEGRLVRRLALLDPRPAERTTARRTS